MKKTIIILSILFALVAISVISFCNINKRCNITITNVKNLEKIINIKNKDMLLKKTTNLECFWEKNSKIMRIFLQREILDNIELEITSLKNNISNFNKAKINKNLQFIEKYCEDVKKNMQPTITNIL